MPNRTKCTVVKKGQLLELLRCGHTLTGACAILGFSLWTLRRHRLKDKQFGDEVQAALEVQVAVVADALYQAAVGGNVKAQIFFLVNRSRHWPEADRWLNTWNIRAEVNHGGKVGHDHGDLCDQIDA